MSESTGATTVHGAGGDRGLRSLSVEPTNLETVVDYYGALPRKTIRGRVIYLNGEAVGIIGLAREVGRYLLFSEYKPELELHLRRFPVLRAVKEVMDMANEVEADVYAIVSTDNADRLLERCGFVDVEQ